MTLSLFACDICGLASFIGLSQKSYPFHKFHFFHLKMSLKSIETCDMNSVCFEDARKMLTSFSFSSCNDWILEIVGK